MTPFLPGPDPHPLRRILIANRGEIAIRVIRACRDLGIETIVAYADADRNAAFVHLADQAFSLEGQSPAETYLEADKLIAIARRSGAEAVHPGYGFLSERASFAAAVQEAGLVWIGPSPAAITRLGDKIAARALATEVGVPLAAGSPGPVESAAEARVFAERHGVPIAIKAAFGGGGRGLRVVRDLDEVENQFDAATREAVAAFGRGECFVEQYLERPRHVEVQVLADRHEQVLVLGTRDCTLQRRNQKLVEEAPAPFLSPDQRSVLEISARNLCQAADYSGAGTVEFLLSADGRLSFLEVNTRLQVEHCVTEEVTGVDLVTGMIRVAQGARLDPDFRAVPRGHAIEFRINAEDPARGFLPTPGRVTFWQAPSGPGVRLDSAVVEGDVIPASFDSLMAKLVILGPTRADALSRAARALAEFRIEGVASVLPFHRAVLTAPEFRATDGAFSIHTRWIETDFAARLTSATAPHPRVAAPNDAPLIRLHVEIDGKLHALGLPPAILSGLAVARPEEPVQTPASAEALIAPLQGLLQSWLVPDGAGVVEGQALATLEAMKMETRLYAHCSGRLTQLVASGAQVIAGETLCRIEAE
jgi:acetyl-CoA/propionyl-CoA carboxylase biotin carboxyl carrier protein